jgi:hypothetical protein
LLLLLLWLAPGPLLLKWLGSLAPHAVLLLLLLLLLRLLPDRVLLRLLQRWRVHGMRLGLPGRRLSSHAAKPRGVQVNPGARPCAHRRPWGRAAPSTLRLAVWLQPLLLLLDSSPAMPLCNCVVAAAAAAVNLQCQPPSTAAVLQLQRGGQVRAPTS